VKSKVEEQLYYDLHPTHVISSDNPVIMLPPTHDLHCRGHTHISTYGSAFACKHARFPCFSQFMTDAGQYLALAGVTRTGLFPCTQASTELWVVGYTCFVSGNQGISILTRIPWSVGWWTLSNRIRSVYIYISDVYIHILINGRSTVPSSHAALRGPAPSIQECPL
jgi:hypothetical protein